MASERAAESAGTSYRLHGTHVCLRIAAESDGRWQRLTISRVDDFIRDLKDAICVAKGSPAGKGNMVTLYGTCNTRLSGRFPVALVIDDVRSGLGNSSAVGPQLVGAVVTAFLDALYKA